MDTKKIVMYGAGALIGLVGLYFIMKPKPAEQSSDDGSGYSSAIGNSMTGGLLPIDTGSSTGSLSSDQVLATLASSQKSQSDQANATTAGALIDSITSQFFTDNHPNLNNTGGIQANLNVGGTKYGFSYILTPPVTPNSDPKNPKTYSSPINTASAA